MCVCEYLTLFMLGCYMKACIFITAAKESGRDEYGSRMLQSASTLKVRTPPHLCKTEDR